MLKIVRKVSFGFFVLACGNATAVALDLAESCCSLEHHSPKLRLALAPVFLWPKWPCQMWHRTMQSLCPLELTLRQSLSHWKVVHSARSTLASPLLAAAWEEPRPDQAGSSTILWSPSPSHWPRKPPAIRRWWALDTKTWNWFVKFHSIWRKKLTSVQFRI
jgi:hypothetical protein